jgi:hypothetical protein
MIWKVTRVGKSRRIEEPACQQYWQKTLSSPMLRFQTEILVSKPTQSPSQSFGSYLQSAGSQWLEEMTERF